MPEETVKYYPVIARILTLLQGESLMTFRAAIISRKGAFEHHDGVIPRFLMEYKGASCSCSTINEQHVEFYRGQIRDYLSRKCLMARREQKQLELKVEIIIDLRSATFSLAS